MKARLEQMKTWAKEHQAELMWVSGGILFFSGVVLLINEKNKSRRYPFVANTVDIFKGYDPEMAHLEDLRVVESLHKQLSTAVKDGLSDLDIIEIEMAIEELTS